MYIDKSYLPVIIVCMWMQSLNNCGSFKTHAKLNIHSVQDNMGSFYVRVLLQYLQILKSHNKKWYTQTVNKMF